MHLYVDTGDVIYANRSLVAVVSSSLGVKRLCMPDGGHLTDALTGETIELDAAHACELRMKRHETRLFWRES